MRTAAERHEALFGRKPTKKQATLYRAYEKSKVRGFSCSGKDEEVLVATILLALHQSETTQPVYLFVPKVHADWVLRVVTKIGRYCFQMRRKFPKGRNSVLDAFKCLRLNMKALQIPEAPPLWVMLGYTIEEGIPQWAANHLLGAP